MKYTLGRGGEGRGGGGGRTHFVARLSRLTIDHASLSRRRREGWVGGGGLTRDVFFVYFPSLDTPTPWVLQVQTFVSLLHGLCTLHEDI